ncbi:hypothetical protein DMUE_1973 [Dictyocoela muelleri]|nr:hypothetical protein DMUE_1973 [Dictyocoela muelleri]
MKLCKSTGNLNNLTYRCSDRTCHLRRSVFLNKLINSLKIPLNNYFLAVYEILCRDYEKRILNDCSISKMSLQNIKSNYLMFFKFYNKKYEIMIFGNENSVQIDETVIFKGKLALYPSQMYDDIPGGTWIIGIIKENSGDNISRAQRETFAHARHF